MLLPELLRLLLLFNDGVVLPRVPSTVGGGMKRGPGCSDEVAVAGGRVHAHQSSMTRVISWGQ